MNRWLLPLLFLPWLLARYVFIPLGLPYFAYALTRLALTAWQMDARGGARVAFVWALLHREDRKKKDEEWLERELLAAAPLSKADLCAYGLLAARRGDPEAARTLLKSVRDLGRAPLPDLASRIASEWVMASYAASGDWEAVLRLGSGLGLADSRTCRFLALVARRFLGVQRVSDRRLIFGWVLASHHLSTYRLLLRALQAIPGAAKRPDPVAVTLPSAALADPLTEALTLHLALLRRAKSALLAADVFRLALAWDRALDAPSTQRLALSRASSLGASFADRCLSDLGTEAERDLVMLLERSDHPLGEPTLGAGPFAAKVVRTRRNELILEIEQAGNALLRRVEERRVLPAIEEWSEWLVLKDKVTRLAHPQSGLLRRHAFRAIQGPAAALAAWLHDERGERALGRAIDAYLVAEAAALAEMDAGRSEPGAPEGSPS